MGEVGSGRGLLAPVIAMRFADIPRLTRSASYMVHVGLDYLVAHYVRYVEHYGLDVSPDFQRNYVWTLQQKIRFIEYTLRGGTSGLDIYCNSPTWQNGDLGPDYSGTWLVLVDGKQRLDAALGFLNNEFPVFGAFYREYEDRMRVAQCHFRWHVNDLQTREEVPCNGIWTLTAGEPSTRRMSSPRFGGFSKTRKSMFDLRWSS